MNKLIQEANELLKNGGFDYAFCGGQGLDLFLGYESRTHGDIDICAFRDDIYGILEHIRKLPEVEIIEEIDYIRHAKANGYRSYHLVLSVRTAFSDVEGNQPGRYFVEVQLRTIAMDSWASLEHKMKYKKDVKNQALIEAELKRCADELAACDVSMETIRNLIRGNPLT